MKRVKHEDSHLFPNDEVYWDLENKIVCLTSSLEPLHCNSREIPILIIPLSEIFNSSSHIDINASSFHILCKEHEGFFEQFDMQPIYRSPFQRWIDENLVREMDMNCSIDELYVLYKEYCCEIHVQCMYKSIFKSGLNSIFNCDAGIIKNVRFRESGIYTKYARQ
jgi:hypothetical protein